jgi:hypothetical protein
MWNLLHSDTKGIGFDFESSETKSKVEKIGQKKKNWYLCPKKRKIGTYVLSMHAVRI